MSLCIQGAPAWLVIIALFTAPLLATGHAESEGLTPLQEHRERHARSTPPTAVATGEVTGSTADAILTNIRLAEIETAAVQDDDVLQLTLGGRVLTTRYLDSASFAALQTSAEARDAIDIDVICTIDSGGGLIIVGLGGGLGDWLQAAPGSRVVLEKP
jgi:hypothetical protein